MARADFDKLLDGLSPPAQWSGGVDAWKALVTYFSTDAAEPPDLHENMRRMADSPDAMKLSITLGAHIGTASTVLVWEPGEPSSTAAPGLTLFDRFAADWKPDLPDLHRDAQASLLRAVERLADSCSDGHQLLAIAEAYLRLPAPTEDFPED